MVPTPVRVEHEVLSWPLDDAAVRGPDLADDSVPDDPAHLWLDLGGGD